MKNLRFSLVMAASGWASLASFSSSAGASDAPPEAFIQQQQTLRETRTKAQLRTRKTREVSGVIIDSKLVVVRGIEERNRVVLLKTTEGDRRLVVDLGPQSALSELDLKKGQKLAAQGVVARVEDAQVLVANRVRQNESTLEITRLAQLAQAKPGPTPTAAFAEIALVDSGAVPVITAVKDKPPASDKAPSNDKPTDKPPTNAKPPSPHKPNDKGSNKKPATEKPANTQKAGAKAEKPSEKSAPSTPAEEKPSADKAGPERPNDDEKTGEKAAP